MERNEYLTKYETSRAANFEAQYMNKPVPIKGRAYTEQNGAKSQLKSRFIGNGTNLRDVFMI